MVLYAPNLLFNSWQTEDLFRDMVNVDEEVGGWLFCKSWAQGVLDFRRFRKRTGQHWIMSIHSWMIVPNVSEFPVSQWSSSNFRLFQQVAEMTARSQRMSAFFFHSHPQGDNEPSHTDIAFTLNHCPLFRDAGASVIVSRSPLRVNAYTIRRNKQEIKIKKGDYYSWRHKVVRECAI